MLAEYSFRCTNPDCVYHKRTTDGLKTKAYGKECSNCVFYEKTNSYCMKKEEKVKPSLYYPKCWKMNPDKTEEMTKYCYVCGSPIIKVPPSLGKNNIITYTKGSGKEKTKPEVESFTLENGKTSVKVTKGGRSLKPKK